MTKYTVGLSSRLPGPGDHRSSLSPVSCGRILSWPNRISTVLHAFYLQWLCTKEEQPCHCWTRSPRSLFLSISPLCCPEIDLLGYHITHPRHIHSTLAIIRPKRMLVDLVKGQAQAGKMCVAQLLPSDLVPRMHFPVAFERAPSNRCWVSVSYIDEAISGRQS